MPKRHLSIAEATREEILEWRDSLDISSKRKNNVLTTLRRAYEAAHMDGQIAATPLSRIKNLRVTSREPNPFTRQEIDLILAQLHGSEKNLIQFAFWSGLRTPELIALKWEHVDTEGKRAFISEAVVEGKTKGTKTVQSTRAIDLHPSAIQALESQKSLSIDCPYVFTDPKTIQRWQSDQFIRKRVWIPALLRAGLEYRNPYQTRHTYASIMFSENKDLGWLQNQMGHRDWGMLRKTYAKYIP